MTIGIISDTHGFLDENVFVHFAKCDEIWHAGDFGSIALIEKIRELAPGKPLRGVYGNIDGKDVRTEFPEQLVFDCKGVKVMMRHIGGSPPKYNPATRKEFETHHPGLFITGHSHILKVVYDEKLNCLHINPGAAGRHGWHQMRTIITLQITNGDMKDCNVIELGKRASL